MSEIGLLVQNAIDCAGRNLAANAFSFGCRAFDLTMKKQLETEQINDFDSKNFIQEHWWIIEFMGLQGRGPISEEVLTGMRKKIPGFAEKQKTNDILAYLIKQNLITKSMPIGFSFQQAMFFELQNEEILVPNRFVYGLLGTAIFHPLNADEKIMDNYWLEFGSFRMFITELWGRNDLLERAVRFS